MKAKYGAKIRPIQCDLSKPGDLSELSRLMSEEKPEIKILINNAGAGQMGRSSDLTDEEAARTRDINCKAVCLLCGYAIPFMSAGARILNISSASAFQLTPYN